MMFAGIREALRTPLARPPGRRGWFVRLGPAWWAAVVYVLLVAGYLISLLVFHDNELLDDWTVPLTLGCFVAWTVGSTILFWGALLSGALAMASERSLGTMDALLMTPIEHARLTDGRYWQGLVPWLKFMALLFPVYLALSGTGIFERTGDEFPNNWERSIVASGVCSWSSKAMFLWLSANKGMLNDGLQWHPWSFALLCLRLVADISVIVLVYTAGFYISARARGTRHALVLACSIVPLALITVFSLHDWSVVALIVALYLHLKSDFYSVYHWIYSALGAASCVVCWPLSWYLHRSACRNFERWATEGADEAVTAHQIAPGTKAEKKAKDDAADDQKCGERRPK